MEPESTNSRPPLAPGAPWERQLLERLAFASLQEQRAARRWGIFFKVLGFAYLTGVLIMFFGWPGGEDLAHDRHTALVEVRGVIESEGANSAENINSALQNAFKDGKTAGVVLRINSPGGSPVQSGIVFDEIVRLRAKYPKIPLHAVVEDLCASGGYYIASAADRIYVNKASIVGSIGVLMDGFGFTGSMEKLGVERRLLTAGEHKGFMDPFSPQDGRQRQHAQILLDDIHKQFIDVVRKGRGDRLKNSPDLFSGLLWTGQRSVDLGLADGFGTVDSVARDVLQAENVVDFTIKQSITDRLAKRFGAGMADSFGSLIRGAVRVF